MTYLKDLSETLYDFTNELERRIIKPPKQWGDKNDVVRLPGGIEYLD